MIEFGKDKAQRETPDLDGSGLWKIELLNEAGERVYESWTGARTQHVIHKLSDELARWRPWFRYRNIRRRLFGRGLKRSDYGMFNVSSPVSTNIGPAPFVPGERHYLVLTDEDGKSWTAAIQTVGDFDKIGIATTNSGAERRVVFQAS